MLTCSGLANPIQKCGQYIARRWQELTRKIARMKLFKYCLSRASKIPSSHGYQSLHNVGKRHSSLVKGRQSYELCARVIKKLDRILMLAFLGCCPKIRIHTRLNRSKYRLRRMCECRITLPWTRMTLKVKSTLTSSRDHRRLTRTFYGKALSSCW